MEQRLKIKKVIAGGRGLALCDDGMVAMLPGVLPGEVVLARTVKALRGHREMEMVQVLEPSADRAAPPCPLYGDCGGCDLQHAAYPAQIHLKREILREALERTHLHLPDGQPEPTLASPQILGYRHRIRLHLDGEGRLGFHRIASNQVVPLASCPLATTAINQALANLNAGNWPQRLASQLSSLELIECPATGRVLLVTHRREQAPPVDDAVLGQLAALADGVATASSSGDKHAANGMASPFPLRQDFALGRLRYSLAWDHRCFFQVNARQNVRLLELALELLDPATGGGSVLELFSGMGNFSVPLALAGATVHGIEHNLSSLGWAEANCQTAGVRTASFSSGDVDRRLHKLLHQGRRFDTIVLDPPRQGLGRTSSQLIELGPRHILAISCDPATQARDLHLMCESGFHLVRIVPVDLFPQTHHIESAALLERN